MPRGLNEPEQFVLERLRLQLSAGTHAITNFTFDEVKICCGSRFTTVELKTILLKLIEKKILTRNENSSGRLTHYVLIYKFQCSRKVSPNASPSKSTKRQKRNKNVNELNKSYVSFNLGNIILLHCFDYIYNFLLRRKQN